VIATKDAIEIYARVGQVIRIRRESVFLTQQELADSASVSRAQVANVEAGKCGVTLHTLSGIAAALRCGAWELLRDAEDAE
jgi:transcriptional regulator with XRE-family HTH domain